MMTTRLSITIYSCLCLGLSQLHSAQPQPDRSDHLVPIEGPLEPAYRVLLYKKLYLTPANYGRIAILPSAGSIGETVFSLHSDGTNGHNVVLTYTQARSNLWSEAHALDDNLAVEPQVRIRRVDIPFPKALAISIAEQIGRMLRGIRKPGVSESIIVDGTDFLFSTETASGSRREGVLIPESKGPKSETLRRLAYFLNEYSNAKGRHRGEVAKRIDGELRRLGDD